MSQPKILMLLTSHGKLGDTGKQTGFWLEELAVPYLELSRAGAQVDLASPAGGRPPADPESEKSDHPAVKEFLADATATGKLADTIRLDDADTSKLASSYDAVLVCGGHGVMWDLAESPAVAKLLSKTYKDGRIVAAVCHGPAALVQATKPGGEPLVQGHRVAGFSNEEESAANLDGIMPFLLESRLRELGGKYENGPTWQPFAVRDGNLVTGQNPASSAAVAREVLAALAARA
ncbi:MAG TPA: type 1 glutamine amidotransferase domain-containing protein [Kofleriaceae bacterium]|nr:type 1 glutamine amidotransferase domain-containing protein [Kofleriaceae bacterium]